MKPSPTLRRFLSAIGAATLAISSTSAATLYWDVDGTTPGFSTVVGAWDGTNAFWNDDITGSAGGSTTAATTTSDDLNFVKATTNTGSTTLSGTQEAGSLTYGSTVGAIALTGGTLNLASAATITTNSSLATVQNIASIISGAGTSLTKNGVGILALTTTNTTFNPGQIIISGGNLRIGNNTATQVNGGSYAGNISIASGSVLQIWSSAAQTLSGVISGDGGINKAYGGMLTLSGANTYTGKTEFRPQTVTGFTVNVSSFNSVVGGTASSSLGAPTTVANGTIDLGDGGKRASVNLTYVSTATGETTDRVINLGFNSTSNQTITANNSTGVLRFTSAFTSNATSQSGRFILRGTGAGQIDLGLPQLATGGLKKDDSGTWTLGGTGNFTEPTTIANGTLIGISANAFGSTSGISIAGAGTLSLRGNTDTSFVKASDSSAYTVNTTASGSTINVDRISGTGAATMTIGDLTTSSTSATWQLNITGDNGAGLNAGALTTPTTASTAMHTINNNIAGGGSLTLANVAGGGHGNRYSELHRNWRYQGKRSHYSGIGSPSSHQERHR